MSSYYELISFLLLSLRVVHFLREWRGRQYFRGTRRLAVARPHIRNHSAHIPSQRVSIRVSVLSWVWQVRSASGLPAVWVVATFKLRSTRLPCRQTETTFIRSVVKPHLIVGVVYCIVSERARSAASNVLPVSAFVRGKLPSPPHINSRPARIVCRSACISSDIYSWAPHCSYSLCAMKRGEFSSATALRNCHVSFAHAFLLQTHKTLLFAVLAWYVDNVQL